MMGGGVVERGVLSLQQQGDGSVANCPTKQPARVSELPGRKDPEFMTDTGLAKKKSIPSFSRDVSEKPEVIF